MKQGSSKKKKAEMLDEYDFSKGVRGKYAVKYSKGSNVVVLDPDVVKVFSDANEVNKALRGLAEIIQSKAKRAG